MVEPADVAVAIARVPAGMGEPHSQPASEAVRWMGRALELARGTVGLASPNPMVGCVLVRGRVLLAEGAHVYDRLDHAEIAALKAARAAGHEVAGATAYVTLEPCSHQGRTGPCADALIAARVGRVVVATADANPQVSGEGIVRLRGAGIEVQVGVCEAEARSLNAGFARWITTGHPLVTLKAAVSADGMLAPAASARMPGETFWITGAEARAEVQRMRHAADAVLTGIGTVLADDPLLTDRSGGARRRRLLRVVLDSDARTPVGSRLVRSAEKDVVVFCGPDAPGDRIAALQAAGVEVVRAATPGPQPGRLDLEAVLDELGGKSVLNVLLECGSQLNGAFLRADLVDQVILFRAPAEMGAGAVPFAQGFGAPELLKGRLSQLQRIEVGRDTRIAGTLRDPWDLPRRALSKVSGTAPD